MLDKIVFHYSDTEEKTELLKLEHGQKILELFLLWILFH